MHKKKTKVLGHYKYLNRFCHYDCFCGRAYMLINIILKLQNLIINLYIKSQLFFCDKQFNKNNNENS